MLLSSLSPLWTRGSYGDWMKSVWVGKDHQFLEAKLLKGGRIQRPSVHQARATAVIIEAPGETDQRASPTSQLAARHQA